MGFGALLLATSAFATVYTGVKTDDFCSKPYDAICGAETTGWKARQARIGEFRKLAGKAALAAVASHLGREPATFTEADFTALQGDQKKEAQRVHDVSALAVERAQLLGLEFSAVHNNVATLRRLLIAAANDAVQGDLLSPVARVLIRKRVKGIRVVSGVGLLERAKKGEQPAAGMATSYETYCRPDGMGDNAFATTYDGDQYIVICPGWLSGAIGQGADGTANFRNALFIIAHEFGHHIDYGTRPAVYERFRECLVDNYADDLKAPATATRAQKALERIFPSYASTRRVDAHINEMTADFWAVRAASSYFRADGSKLPYADRLQLLREAWSGLCGGGDDGRHPDDEFRIGVLLGRDPAVRAAMGCGELKTEEPACTLDGAAR